jgi:hypothetical protein
VLSETFLGFSKLNQTKLFEKAEAFVSDHKLFKNSIGKLQIDEQLMFYCNSRSIMQALYSGERT